MHCSGGSFANERPMPAVHQSASIPISKRPCHLSHEFVSVAEAFSHLPLERMLRPEANVFTGCPKAQSKMHFRSSSDYVQHKAVPKYKRKKRVDREKKLFPVGTSISGVEEVFIPEMWATDVCAGHTAILKGDLTINQEASLVVGLRPVHSEMLWKRKKSLILFSPRMMPGTSNNATRSKDTKKWKCRSWSNSP